MSPQRTDRRGRPRCVLPNLPRRSADTATIRALHLHAVDPPIATEFDIPFRPEVVLDAYRLGIFPMGEGESDTIFWFRPDPRAVIPLDRFHISRSLQRTLRRGLFDVTFNEDFAAVMRGCAEDRPMWITERVHELYQELHARGRAHSVEVWQEGHLVGGTYGVQVGGVFMAESKFHRVTDASKVALAKLVEHLRERDFALLEVQYLTEHLVQFGTVEIPLDEYLATIERHADSACEF